MQGAIDETNITFKLITKYIYKELPLAQELELEDFLDQNANYAEFVDELLDYSLQHNLTSRRALEEHLDQAQVDTIQAQKAAIEALFPNFFLDTSEPDQTQPPKNVRPLPFRRLIYIGSAVAAAILILIIAVPFFSPPKAQEVPEGVVIQMEAYKKVEKLTQQQAQINTPDVAGGNTQNPQHLIESGAFEQAYAILFNQYQKDPSFLSSQSKVDLAELSTLLGKDPAFGKTLLWKTLEEDPEIKTSAIRGLILHAYLTGNTTELKNLTQQHQVLLDQMNLPDFILQSE